MKKIILSGLLILALGGSIAQVEEVNNFVKLPAEILKDTWSLLYYKRDFLRFAEDFQAYDETFHKIDKGLFLKKLTSGNYLPLRFTKDDHNLHRYKLYKLNASASNDIKYVITSWGEEYQRNYSYEGKQLPAFIFRDINNKVYSSKIARGNILVIKCWFIHCQVCVEEIPELNQLVSRYRNRKDVVFLSLALDKKNVLQAFLKTTPLNYISIPNQSGYIQQNLGITGYPTHIIVSKTGTIMKVVNNADELEYALNKIAPN